LHLDIVDFVAQMMQSAPLFQEASNPRLCPRRLDQLDLRARSRRMQEGNIDLLQRVVGDGSIPSGAQGAGHPWRNVPDPRHHKPDVV
jgi:hypothetical protein